MKLNLNKPILAPLAKISNYPYKKIYKKFDYKIIYTKIINVNTIHYNNKTTYKILKKTSRIKPVMIQLFGDDPERFIETARFIEENEMADGIDINFGCPVKKVI